jgi:heme/copper-type cytochrome/quinol oxidase subunit 3
MAHPIAELVEHRVEHIPLPRPVSQHPPVSPGKFAMWLFLATEIMFFTGLIGSYIVLRAGSPDGGFSNLFPPGTNLTNLKDSRGVLLEEAGPDPAAIAKILRAHLGDKAYNRLVPATEHSARLLGGPEPIHDAHGLEHGGHFIATLPNEAQAKALLEELEKAGAKAKIEPLKIEGWPKPYDDAVNPLSINLTAINTFILICSSVTMVFALAAIERDARGWCTFWLWSTAGIGAVFLSVQVYEYYQLMFGHHYPIGISASGHFRPSVSIFASCFFTMTGFHGAHVAGGVILLSCIALRSTFGGYTARHHSPVELSGLYWHFVDLVWIILFTVAYLI